MVPIGSRDMNCSGYHTDYLRSNLVHLKHGAEGRGKHCWTLIVGWDYGQQWVLDLESQKLTQEISHSYKDCALSKISFYYQPMPNGYGIFRKTILIYKFMLPPIPTGELPFFWKNLKVRKAIAHKDASNKTADPRKTVQKVAASSAIIRCRTYVPCIGTT